MSLTVKKFENKDLNISLDAYVDNKQNIWFKGKEVATLLGYKNQRKAIIDYVDCKYKTEYDGLKGVTNCYSLKNVQPHTVYIKEPGLFSLIFGSKLETAEMLQDWVFSEYYHLSGSMDTTDCLTILIH